MVRVLLKNVPHLCTSFHGTGEHDLVRSYTLFDHAVCSGEREREREREREKEIERVTESQRERERERDRKSQRESKRERGREI